MSRTRYKLVGDGSSLILESGDVADELLVLRLPRSRCIIVDMLWDAIEQANTIRDPMAEWASGLSSACDSSHATKTASADRS